MHPEDTRYLRKSDPIAWVQYHLNFTILTPGDGPPGSDIVLLPLTIVEIANVEISKILNQCALA